MKIRNMSDVLAGLTLVVLAGVALTLAWSLETGTTTFMKAGFVPQTLSYVMFLIGAALIAQGVLVDGEAMEPIGLKPLIWILTSILVFAVMIERWGLFAAIISMVVVAKISDGKFRVKETLILALAAATVAILLFVKALGLVLPILPRGW